MANTTWRTLVLERRAVVPRSLPLALPAQAAVPSYVAWEDAVRARQRLSAGCVPRLSDWPVHLWSRLAVAHPAPVPQGEGAVFGAEYAPDGRVLAVVREAGALALCDPHTGQPLATWPHAHEEPVNAVVFATPWHLLTASDDRTVRLWDTRLGGGHAPLLTLPSRGDWAKSCVYVRAAGVVLTTSLDGTLAAYDLRELHAGPASSSSSSPPPPYNSHTQRCGPYGTEDRGVRAGHMGAADGPRDDSSDEEEEDEDDDRIHSEGSGGSGDGDGASTAWRLLWRLRLPGVLFARLSPDSTRLVLTTSKALLLVVHHLDVRTLGADLVQQQWRRLMTADEPTRIALLSRMLARKPHPAISHDRNVVEVVDWAGMALRPQRAGQTSFTTPQWDATGTRLYVRAAHHRPPGLGRRIMHVGAVYDMSPQRDDAMDEDVEAWPTAHHWIALRCCGLFEEQVNVADCFHVSAVSGDGRLVCSPTRDGVALVHIGHGFTSNADEAARYWPRAVADDPGRRRIRMAPLEWVLRRGSLDGLALAPLPILHHTPTGQSELVGCAASPVAPIVASYGMRGDLAISAWHT
jgi:hypothetical protein